MVMTWTGLQLGDRLAEIASSIAGSLKIMPTR